MMDMADKLNGFKDNHSLAEAAAKDTVYRKQEIDAKLEALPVFRSGTANPDNSVGKDGDFYLKLEQ